MSAIDSSCCRPPSASFPFHLQCSVCMYVPEHRVFLLSRPLTLPISCGVLSDAGFLFQDASVLRSKWMKHFDIIWRRALKKKKGIYLRPYLEVDFSPLWFVVCCHPKLHVFSCSISYRVFNQNRTACYDVHFIITQASPVFSGTVVCFTKATSPEPEARQRKAPV